MNAAMNFDEAFQALIGHEGKYVNNPEDPGAETNFGISKRSYPAEDIKNLTLDRAKQIYLRDFWAPAGCDDVPGPIRFDVFDMAVNSGVRAAIKTLQATVGVVQDGVLGPQTIAALKALDPVGAAARFNGARLVFMTTLPKWPVFSRGWAVRIGENLLRL